MTLIGARHSNGRRCSVKTRKMDVVELGLSHGDASLAGRETQTAPFLPPSQMTNAAPMNLSFVSSGSTCCLSCKCTTNYFVVLAEDRGCPAQRRPVARVPTPPHWFHNSKAFPSLALGTRREERDCVSVPAAANGTWLKNIHKNNKNSWMQNAVNL